MWPLGCPDAVTLLWQLPQFVMIPVWSITAGMKPLVV